MNIKREKIIKDREVLEAMTKTYWNEFTGMVKTESQNAYEYGKVRELLSEVMHHIDMANATLDRLDSWKFPHEVSNP